LIIFGTQKRKEVKVEIQKPKKKKKIWNPGYETKVVVRPDFQPSFRSSFLRASLPTCFLE
jgi:hypothetical protein